MKMEGEERDPLTGALLRPNFETRVHQEIERARRYNKNLTLIVLDLDHFKSINDTYGHFRGDEVLKELVARLHSCIRTSDMLFRYGGDEFVMLLPNTPKDQALVLGVRLVETIKSSEFDGDPPLNLSLSAGLSTFPEDAKDWKKLFESADLRLLEAKHQGRSRVVSEDPEEVSPLQFDTGSRWIEREEAVETFKQFLGEIHDKKRGVLCISGPGGSGRSRCVTEISKAAKRRGHEVMMFRGNPGLKGRPYAALMEARKEWDYRIPNGDSKEEIAKNIEGVLEDSKTSAFMIAVDDLEDIDRATMEFLRYLTMNTKLPVFSLVYSIDTDNLKRVVPFQAPLWHSVEITSFSKPGLLIWLRQILQTEPPSEFLDWLHRETKGLPGFVVKAINYLVKRRIYAKNDRNEWEMDRDLKEIHLAEKIGIHIKEIPNNLPTLMTGFVGRDPEVQHIIQNIEDNNLISLVGPGGVGKKRLALRAAAEKIRYFQHGVFLVSFLSVISEELIYPAVGDAIRLEFSDDEDPKTQLMNHLIDREMLLIFTHIEHLPDFSALVTEILDHCL